MNYNNTYTRFDWAIKRLLRDKANFSVLEGLLTVLFNDQTKIVEILENESNRQWNDEQVQPHGHQAKNSKGEIIAQATWLDYEEVRQL